ncbi:DUF1868 domain-containing protein [Buttiauxella warmboldiae]|uniref:DUF1868 domain-containing protein n=1 Tax=Buttiauxella warmboldiae TaxID=82993 RepID=A0A3N5DNY1_9ENTR|nr:DUF1868 domain-containing protein [Buttiauxella warmboldiae]RPH29327.1 DUF1868 domain-containing protein [Buttiauxella warmboldiae]
MNQRHLPVGVTNGKFDENGNALPFVGNTVIVHITHTLLYLRLCDFHARLAQSALTNNLYSLLPPQSYHITLFDGACKKSEEGWYWPTNLPISASLQACTEFMVSKINENAIVSPELTFSVSAYKPVVNTLAIIVQPSGDTVEQVQVLRDKLSSALGIRRRNHYEYVYHITLGYLLRTPSPTEQEMLSTLLQQFISELTEEESILKLEKAELCQYESITAFSPILYF